MCTSDGAHMLVAIVLVCTSDVTVAFKSFFHFFCVCTRKGVFLALRVEKLATHTYGTVFAKLKNRNLRQVVAIISER